MYCKTLNPQESLSLRNDGKLELFFIGVGSAFAVENFQTNFFIIKGDKHILVDFGATGPHALKNTARLQTTDIDVVLPTHSHADHIAGLENIGLSSRYVGTRFMKKDKVKIITDENYQRILWSFSLQGGLEWNEVDGMAHKLQFSDYFDVIRPTWKCFSPRETFEVNYGDIHLEIFRTNHIPEQSSKWEASFVSYGVFIDDHVFVSGDTKFDKDLIDIYASKSDVMFHDVQFFPGAVHAPLADLKTLPADIKKKMYLMHYADNWKSQDISDFGGWVQQGVRYIF